MSPECPYCATLSILHTLPLLGRVNFKHSGPALLQLILVRLSSPCEFAAIGPAIYQGIIYQI